MFMVIAVVMAVAAVGGAISDRNLRAHGVTTTATVVRERSQVSRKSVKQVTYQIGFVVGGKQHSDWISGLGNARIGDTVTVVYDPGNPDYVQAESSLSDAWWLGRLVTLLMAVAFGGAGWFLWRRTRRPADLEVQPAAFG